MCSVQFLYPVRHSANRVDIAASPHPHDTGCQIGDSEVVPVVRQAVVKYTRGIQMAVIQVVLMNYCIFVNVMVTIQLV